MKHFSATVLFVLVYFTTTSQVSLIDSINLVTDGEVYTVSKTGNKIFFGGSFSKIGNRARYGVVTDTSSNIVQGFPGFNDEVYASVDDGQGGFIATGLFTKVGDSIKSQVVHVNSTGQVTNFHFTYNHSINCLTRKGDTLFIGGDFDTLNGIQKKYFAAFSISNGNAINYSVQADGPVYTLEIKQNRIYLGGEFLKLGSDTVNGVGAIDLNADTLINLHLPADSGNISILGMYPMQVYSLALTDSTIWIRGNIRYYSDSVTGTYNIDIGEFRLSDGKITSRSVGLYDWGASSGGDMILKGDTLILSGNDFNILPAGTLYGDIALYKLNPSSISEIKYFDTDFSIYTMELCENKLYFSGDFSMVDSITHSGGACADLSTLALTAWDPGLPTYDYLNTISCIAPGKLFIGGSFHSFYAVSRKNLGSFDISTQTLTSWNPEPDDDVWNIVTEGNRAVVLGYFTNMSAVPRDGIAAFDTLGNLLAFDPLKDETIGAIHIYNHTLYISGNFTMIDSIARNHAAAFNLSDFSMKLWAPALAGPSIYTYADGLASAEGKILLSGNFTTVNSVAIKYAALVDTINGTLTHSQDLGYVSIMYQPYGYGSYIYFNDVNNYLTSYSTIKRIDVNTLAIDSFNIDIASAAWGMSENYVRTISVYDTIMVIGGTFDTLNGQPHGSLIFWSIPSNTPITNAASSQYKVNGSFFDPSVLILATNENIYNTAARTIPGDTLSKGVKIMFRVQPQITLGESSPQIIKESLIVFPNPSSDFTKIDFGNIKTVSNHSTVSITDVTGREIKKIEVINQKENLLDVSDLPRGIYFVTVRNGNSVLGSCKFIKT